MEAMPFTPAHAAAALPFVRFLVPSALVVGTMAPDFEYFLRFAPGGGFGHTIPGAFLLSLPLALLVLWTFHLLLKDPLVLLCPEGFRRRIQAHAVPFRFGGPARFLFIVVSALAGIATHLMWDSFTHRDTWPYRHFHLLAEEAQVPLLGPFVHFGILQLGSSALGIVIVLAWIAYWYRTTTPIGTDRAAGVPASRRILILAGITAVAAVGGVIRAAMVAADPGEHHGWVTIAGDGSSTAIALAWWMTVIYAVAVARGWFRPAF